MARGEEPSRRSDWRLSEALRAASAQAPVMPALMRARKVVLHLKILWELDLTFFGMKDRTDDLEDGAEEENEVEHGVPLYILYSLWKVEVR